MEQQLGITGPQRFTLRLIGRFPGITAGQLADALNVHASTMTGIVKRLMKRKLVVRRADPLDRRRSALALTGEGRALNVAPEGTVEGAISQVLATLPKGQVQSARAVLAALSAALDVREGELKAAAG
ncbi:MAG: MarR family transcriptional regulator [Myxococcaceae bacterium]|nr:MarR family transcriptional regulator [Myxococcaceae bacterium]